MNTELPIQVSAIRAEEGRTLTSPEYALVLSLSEGVSLWGAQDAPVPAGTLLFLAPFSGRKLHMATGSHVIYAVIPSETLESLMGIPKRATMTLLQNGSDSAREKLIEYFDIVCNHRSVSPLTRTRVAYELLSALEPSIANEISPSQKPEAQTSTRIPHMLSFVEENFRKPLQLSDLAEEFSVSRQYVSTVFHRELGVPFSEYLTNLRLEEAHRLLLTTSENITTVCQESGFPNLKALNQAFRARYGLSPKEFRKQRIAPMEPAAPDAHALRDVNQLLRPYRLVYQKYETAVHAEELVAVGEGTPLRPCWDILNIDNAAACLQSSVQESLLAVQRELGFRYVRLLNLFSVETTPFIPSQGRHRFTDYLRVMEFFKKLDLTPILVLGENYSVMVDGVMLSEGYQMSPAEWYAYLAEILEVSVSRWGMEWVSRWRFEFHFPENLFGQDSRGCFIDLFEKSAAMIREKLRSAQIGGPAIPVDGAHLPRLKQWLREVVERKIPVDYISVELWADFTYKKEEFAGFLGERHENHMLDAIQNADNGLPVQKIQLLRSLMAQYGVEELPICVAALGITKYQAAAAQQGGHCAAFLVKSNLDLMEQVEGIGCWKALSSETEYADEYQIIGSGCGLMSRYDLRNINWYGQVFLTGLMPFVLQKGMNSIVTTDRNGSFAVILHNCKSYSPWFCKHYLDARALDFEDPRLYTSGAALEQTIRLVGVKPGAYRVEQHLVGDHHGCVSAVLRQMGSVHVPGEHEVEYLYGQSLPFQHAYQVEASDSLDFAVTLQANEVMLLRIHPI